MAIKKSDLYSSIWASCDELRGGMDASQYKDYVLFLLFIKYISDKWADTDLLEPPINIPEGASFKDMVALKGKPGIGDSINKQVIQKLCEANPTRLFPSDFPNFNDPTKLGEGPAMVERLGNLISIFQKTELDFSKNRADNDDILGDAYEYLMRHFASESGKSKGQFYTPAEVSRIMAKVIGISPSNAVVSTTAYDPTCGSGSLLLKIADQAGKRITLEGQEMDVTTAGLARMNMILHDFTTAKIVSGNTLASPKFKEGAALRTYDYVVANPPFSDKAWSTGLLTDDDPFQRWAWGVPPKKQGDYAYLLHIIRSMNSTGKAACILPHGVLFRGNAEEKIREQLVLSGFLKGIIGLPANLFYGTGIPACILVLDKAGASTRKGVYLVDASKGFIKDGPKNRLRDQDIHKIVDAFSKLADMPGFAKMVPREDIIGKKNGCNLNLPRYIDSSEPEDLQDLDGHLRGGIPERDLDAFAPYWNVMPGLRAALFEGAGRLGYWRFRDAGSAVNTVVTAHPEFIAFDRAARTTFKEWAARNSAALRTFDKDGRPKVLIASLSEDLLAAFRAVPLLNAYDVYQHLMTYWLETMQDDCYLVAADGWTAGAKPRELKQVKNKDNKLVWAEAHDYKKGAVRYKADLIPGPVLTARYFGAERDLIATLETEIAEIERKIEEELEERGFEGGPLDEGVVVDENKRKITAKSVKDALKKFGADPDYEEERSALKVCLALFDSGIEAKSRLKKGREDLDTKLAGKYATLTEAEIKTLVVDDKWRATLSAAVQGELDRVSQTLTSRIRELAERYATPLPKLTDEVEALSAQVEGHLKKMGASWN